LNGYYPTTINQHSSLFLGRFFLSQWRIVSIFKAKKNNHISNQTVQQWCNFWQRIVLVTIPSRNTILGFGWEVTSHGIDLCWLDHVATSLAANKCEMFFVIAQ